MQLISVPVVGYSRGWAPAPYAPPSPRVQNPRLGQAATDADKPLSLIDSPFIALVTDVAAASSLAMLAYFFHKGNSAWSNVFWALAGLAGAKTIVDMTRLSN